MLDLSDNLTKRERDVMELLCSGMSNREISKSLNISIETVKKPREKYFIQIRRTRQKKNYCTYW